MSDKDEMAAIEEIVAEAEATGSETVAIPTALARFLIKRAKRGGRKPNPPSLARRHDFWFHLARLRRKKLVDSKEYTYDEANKLVAEELRQKLVDQTKRWLSLSTIERKLHDSSDRE